MELSELMSEQGRQLARLFGVPELQLMARDVSTAVFCPMARIDRSIEETLALIAFDTWALEQPGHDFHLGIPIVVVIKGHYVPPGEMSAEAMKMVYRNACLDPDLLYSKLNAYKGQPSILGK
jgi:hypothetical protein